MDDHSSTGTGEKKTGLKALVFGIDGASFSVIRPLIEKGRLPHLKRLMEGGIWGELRSTIPPVSACAWSSLMTGKNPGRHGIFHWRTYNPKKYTSQEKELISNRDIRGRTFWDFLGGNGYRVGVVTVPVTYPVWEMNGYMVAGYPCPDKHLNYTFPEEFADELKESYNFQVDYYARTPDTEIVKNGLRMLERRASLAIHLAEEKKIEICVLVLGEVDRVQHDFWKYKDPRFRAYHECRDHILKTAIESHYEMCDRQLGRMLGLCSDDTLIVALSDHGGAPHPLKSFAPNSWLLENGFLTLKNRSGRRRSLSRFLISRLRSRFPYEERLKRLLPEILIDKLRSIHLGLTDIDWEKTKAYRFPMYHPAEGIEINVRGRQPEGIVSLGKEYEELRRLIKAKLLETRDPDSQNPVVTSVFLKEEIYKGKYLDIAPDIIFLTSPDYRAYEGFLSPGFVGRYDLDSLEKYNGVHTMEGIFIASGKNIRRGDQIGRAELMDVAPTILYALGHPVSREMDGKILLDIFEDSFRSKNLPRFMDESVAGPVEGHGLSPQEKKEMENKLRGLGYFE